VATAIPLGGKLYSSQTLPLILDLVNIVNGADFSNKDTQDDETGEVTIQTLKNVRRVAYRLNSNHSSSLGLHPVIYFYSQDGRHKTASFFAMIDFVVELDSNTSDKI